MPSNNKIIAAFSALWSKIFNFFAHKNPTQENSPACRRIRALIVKEFYQIIRDPSSILIAVIFPLILLFIYGYGISLDFENLKIGLVLQDKNPKAQSFALALRNSKFFSVDMSDDQKMLEEKLIADKIYGIVIVPFYFSRYINSPPQAGPIYVVTDGSSPNTANFVQNYVKGAWLNWLNQEAISSGTNQVPQVNIESRFWYNEELNSRHFLVPGSIATIMTLIGTLLTALVIAREWERGTIEALMTTPITMKEFLLSKMIAYFTLGILSMAICTAISIFLFGVPFRGSFSALVLVSSVFLVGALASGLLISAIARNQFIASQISLITAFLPSFMLSGFIFEISSMPLPIRLITYIIPAKYMVSSLQTLFLVGNVWKLLIVNIIYMAIVAIILLIIMSFKAKKRLD